MTSTTTTLGAAIDRLQATIEERGASSPEESYTAKLLADGPARCAKKLGEEGVEAALAAALGDRPGLIGEAADVVYHLLVALKAAGVSPADVADELARREGVSGLSEKASRSPQ